MTMQTPASDPATIDLPEYVVVFDGNQAPKESEFTCLDDEQAKVQTRKQYANSKWKLYRTSGTWRKLVYSYPQ